MISLFLFQQKLNILHNFAIIDKVGIKEVTNMLKYEKGKIVTGQVTGIEKYGIFVSLDEFYSGLIHISEISDGFVKDINDYVDIGETIQAKVVETDEKAYHVRLSIKNMNYRMAKRKNSKLKETVRGFDPLEEQLPVWISKKLQELQQNEMEKDK